MCVFVVQTYYGSPKLYHFMNKLESTLLNGLLYFYCYLTYTFIGINTTQTNNITIEQST